MAGDWIKVECSTPDKPEVLAMTAALGWDDPDHVVGKLIRVWRWFDQQTEDGNASVTEELLDRIAAAPGFASAMLKVGWLTINDGIASLPNFSTHCGNSAKARAETGRRVAKHRAKKDVEAADCTRQIMPRPLRQAVIDRDGNQCVYCDRPAGQYAPPEMASDAVMCIDHVIPLSRGGAETIDNLACACACCNTFKGSRTPEECGLRWPVANGKRLGNAENVTPALAREEKRREEETKALRAVKPALPDWMPLEAWTGWLEMRRKNRKVPTTRAVEMAIRQLDKLRSGGQDPAAVLDQSTMNSWTDLYPLKADRAGPRAMPAWAGAK
jgi:hypothetical protein